MLIGSIIGDAVGSIYEFDNVKTISFPLFSEYSTFTDDTVLTIAIADSILNKKDFAKTILEYATNYPHRGYAGRFSEWINRKDLKPYNSFGNGSAMRVSPVGFAYNNLEKVLEIAKETAEITHNHPEGIKGAQAIASSIFLARTGKNKEEIKEYISQTFNYDLEKTISQIRNYYVFDETCQGTVPEAIIAFLESNDYENAIRLAISIGGDSDTIACMTGGIASAFYKEIPEKLIYKTNELLPKEFKEIIDEFNKKYNNENYN